MGKMQENRFGGQTVLVNTFGKDGESNTVLKVLLHQQNHLLKQGKQKYFVTTKSFVLSTKHLVAAAKFLVAATKKLFVVPNFVAVTKPFFSVNMAR